MNVYECAVGDCIVCGKNAEGSLYWTPLPDEVWQRVRTYVAQLFEDEDHVQNILFIEGESKPFCGYVCSLRYHEENRHGDDI